MIRDDKVAIYRDTRPMFSHGFNEVPRIYPYSLHELAGWQAIKARVNRNGTHGAELVLEKAACGHNKVTINEISS